MKKIFLPCFLLIFFCESSLLAQQLVEINKTRIEKPLAISVDKKAALFIADQQGNINKYDSLGNLELNFSPQRIREADGLEAWLTLRIFVFYQDFQEYTLLDRFLNPKADEAYRFNSPQIGFVQAASLAADNDIWLFDNTDFSLKKYNPQTENISVNTALDLLLNPRRYEINFIREYQNLLMVNDPNSGILIFDNLGNYKKTLPYLHLKYIGVLANEICVLKEQKLELFDLYSSAIRSIQLPTGTTWQFATLLSPTKLVALSDQSLHVFQINTSD